MTNESEEHPQGEPQTSNQPAKSDSGTNIKRSRPAVAKTMLESELPDLTEQQLQSAQPKVKKARVARTMLEGEIPTSPLTDLSESPFVREPKTKIAKTLMEYSIHESFDEPLQSTALEPVQEVTSFPYETLVPQADITGLGEQSSTAPKPSIASSKTKRIRRTENFVARTMLDHSVLFDALAKSTARKEQKAAEEAIEKAKEPVKEFHGITDFKMADACPWVWDDPDSKDKFRYCGQCKAPVYNFEGLELPEAQALIFKRENRENAHLYKRTDGKFMTSNCVVQAKRKQTRIMLIAVAAAVAIGLVAIVALTPPAPPAPAPIAPTVDQSSNSQTNSAQTSSQSDSKAAPSTSTNGSQKVDGSFHWDSTESTTSTATTPGTASSPGTVPSAGGTTSLPPSSSTNTTPSSAPTNTTTTTVSPQDESGQFWQYSNNQGNTTPSQ